MSLCDYSNVQILTSPSVLKLLDSQRYLWLSYDLAEVIKLIAVTFKQKMCCFISKKNTLCHSALVLFLLDYSHSFGISVIPSGFLSLLPDYCHSFGISVIYSELLPFQIFVIPNNCGTLPWPKVEGNLWVVVKWKALMAYKNRKSRSPNFYSI